MINSGSVRLFDMLARLPGFGLLVLGQALQAGPLWQQPGLHLGALGIDGGLRQSFLLGTLSGSPEFSFPVMLEHGFRTGEALSDFRVPQLESYVVPEGRDGIVWREPGGMHHSFQDDELLAAVPECQVQPWVAVRTGPADYEFHSDDGWCYRYEGGAIVSLSAPSGRVLEFDTEGLRIQRIFQRAGDREITLLEARENEIGLLGELQIGPELHGFEYSEDREQLVRWHAPQMGRNEVGFGYTAEGLVDRINLPDEEWLSYTWGGRDGAWQSESGYQLPETEHGVFLAGDRDFRFQYGMTKQGIHLMRTDALGIREGFCFNPKTQQMVHHHRDGGESTEFYGLRGASRSQLESARDAQGREAVRLTYDDKGRVLTRTEPGLAPVRFEYDGLDRITRVFRLDQLQKSYEYEGDSQRPVRITNALGDSIEIAYRPDGQVERYRNLDGAVFEFRYDELGQLIEECHPMGYSKTIEYDEFGRVTRIEEIDGRVTTWSYDEANRLAAVEKNGETWQYEYDPDGHLTRLLRDGETWQQTERERIAETGGLRVTETNSRGDETVHQFDRDGNLVRQVDALGHETRYKRDAIGQLAGWEDPRGVTVDFERDALGRVSGVETPEIAKLEFAYDLTGRIRSKNNGEQDIRFDYDKAGRLVQIDYGKGEIIDYTYDAYGRVLTALTGQGVKTTYTWDALDRKTSERNDIPGMGYTLLEWTYTPSGRKASVAVWRADPEDQDNFAPDTAMPISLGMAEEQNPPGGEESVIPKRLQTTGYAYDDLGRYERIDVNGEPAIWYDYDPGTLQLMKKRYANGWIISYDYHQDAYPKTISVSDQDGDLSFICQYTWSDNGKLASKTVNNTKYMYSYDAEGKVIGVCRVD